MPRTKNPLPAEDDAVQKVAQKNTALEKAKTEKMYGPGGKHNFPNAAPPENPEDARRVLNETLFWYGLPRAEGEQKIAERLEFFFEHCAKNGERPTVEKMALALGYARKTLWAWKTGQQGSKKVQEIMERAYDVLAAYDAGMAIEGKMNPVPYIFRAKNYYNMKDSTDITVTPNNPLGEAQDPDTIAAKYQELPDE
jgi:hypothetical protein